MHPQKMLFEKALEDIGRENVQQSEFRRDFSGLFFGLELPLSVKTAYETIVTEGNPIWGVVGLLLTFLPGLEWHSQKNLVSSTKIKGKA